MDIESVDPRDTGWESNQAVYRVYLWTPARDRCSEHRLTGAVSVQNALAWAEEQVAAGGPYDGWTAELWLEVDARLDGLGLVRLDEVKRAET